MILKPTYNLRRNIYYNAAKERLNTFISNEIIKTPYYKGFMTQTIGTTVKDYIYEWRMDRL